MNRNLALVLIAVLLAACASVPKDATPEVTALWTIARALDFIGVVLLLNLFK